MVVRFLRADQRNDAMSLFENEVAANHSSNSIACKATEQKDIYDLLSLGIIVRLSCHCRRAFLTVGHHTFTDQNS